LSHLPKYGNFGYYRVSSDEISPLSQPASQVDEMKISSGVSQSHMGDELIEIVQYLAIFPHNLIVLVRRIRELTSLAGRYSKTYLHHFIAFMAFYGLVDFLM
jgi:hypothetical protein